MAGEERGHCWEWAQEWAQKEAREEKAQEQARQSCWVQVERVPERVLRSCSGMAQEVQGRQSCLGKAQGAEERQSCWEREQEVQGRQSYLEQEQVRDHCWQERLMQEELELLRLSWELGQQRRKRQEVVGEVACQSRDEQE